VGKTAAPTSPSRPNGDLIADLAQLKPRLQEAQQKKLQTQIEYFEHNAHRMKYKEIIAAREAVAAGTATAEQINSPTSLWVRAPSSPPAVSTSAASNVPASSGPSLVTKPSCAGNPLAQWPLA